MLFDIMQQLAEPYVYPLSFLGLCLASYEGFAHMRTYFVGAYSNTLKKNYWPLFMVEFVTQVVTCAALDHFVFKLNFLLHCFYAFWALTWSTKWYEVMGLHDEKGFWNDKISWVKTVAILYDASSHGLGAYYFSLNLGWMYATPLILAALAVCVSENLAEVRRNAKKQH